MSKIVFPFVRKSVYNSLPESFNGPHGCHVFMLELDPLCLDVKMYGPPQAHGAD